MAGLRVHYWKHKYSKMLTLFDTCVALIYLLRSKL